MTFTPEEIAYLRSQPLARLATVDAEGQPDVVAVGFEYDGDVPLCRRARRPVNTRKFRNVRAGNDRVALVVDDLVSADPWTPRFMRVYGRAELVEREGMFGPGHYMRITPTLSWSWNLDAVAFGGGDEFGPRRTVHDPAA